MQKFRSCEVASFMRQNRIESKFILPASPWWRGFYERLVRSIKLPLKKVLGKSRLSYEEMETALIDVEGIVNSRPLTFLYDNDVTQPLTPSHLLAGRSLNSKPGEVIQSSVIPVETLGRRSKFIQRVIEMYWNRFKTNYLAQLREHHMYINKHSKINNDIQLKIGDVVIIKDDNVSPRSTWRSRYVESFIVGNDGRIRGAELRTISKAGKRTKLKRPLQKLIPLEAANCESIDAENKPTTSASDTSIHNVNPHPAETIAPDTHIHGDSTATDIAKIENKINTDISCHNTRPKRSAAITGETIRRLQSKK